MEFVKKQESKVNRLFQYLEEDEIVDFINSNEAIKVDVGKWSFPGIMSGYMMWFKLRNLRDQEGALKSEYDLEIRDLVTLDDSVAKKYTKNVKVHVGSVSKKRLKLM